jgi:hypothetical protein
MKTLIQRTRYVRLIGSKVMIRLILASAVSVLSLSSALADHDNGHGRGNRGDDYGRQEWHGDRDDYRGHQEWRGEHNGYGGYRPRYQYPYNYAQPVYVPPPVYYPPQQSPGISLFFPLNPRW